MLNKKYPAKQTVIHLFTILLISVLFFGCSNSENKTVVGENVPSDSALFNQPGIENNEYEGDAREREDWFIQQRKYPFDELPENARREAWLSRPANAMRDGIEVANWQPIGPSPTTAFFPGNWGVTSGRINVVAVSPTNPQLVLLGAATGGVWRSTNGGTSFTPVSDNHVDLAVGSIAFAPSNPAIVYAGMGDKAASYLGTGILKSTDAGQTWAQVSNTTFPNQGRVTKIQVDPNNANRVYVTQHTFRQNNVTNNASGFWVSTDGGVNWQRTLTGVATDLVIHPTQPNTIYAGLSHVLSGQQFVPGGVFKSTNSGQNWSQIYTAVNGTVNVKVSVTPAAPQWVYMLMGFYNSSNAEDARLEISTDEGASWNLRSNAFDKGQIFFNCYLLAHPTNANAVLVGTRDIWGSNDAGASFFNVTKNFNLQGTYNPPAFGANSHPDQHHAFIAASNPSVIYIANDGGLSRSTDSGATFQSLNASLSLTMFTSIDLHPTNAAISYGGTQDNGTQKRTGGLSWQEFSAGDGGQTVIDVLDPSIVFATYIYHTITRHTNNAAGTPQTVGSATIFGNDRVAFYPPFEGNGVNSNLYFGTYRLWISTNRGDSWTAPGGTTDLTNGGNATLSAIGVGKSNTNTIYTGSSDGKLSVSTNGGVSWINRSAGLPNRHIKSVIVNPTDANVAYVTVSGFDSGHVFKTTNAGVSWTDISGNLPNIPTNTLLIDMNTPTTLYVGTDVGVFRSTTDGNTWETYNTGMPPVIISELDMQQSGLMQAATYGRGAYQMTAAQGCNYAINPTSQNVGANAGSGSFTMTTAQGCQWQAVSNAGWLTTSSSGNGNGMISFNYAANPGAEARTGQITVGGQTFTLTQAGQSPTCTYSINPTSQNFPANGGSGSIQVSAAGGCAWTAVSNSLTDFDKAAGKMNLSGLPFGIELLKLSKPLTLNTSSTVVKTENSGNSLDFPTATFPGIGVGAIPDGLSGTPPQYGPPLVVSFAVSGITAPITSVSVDITLTHSYVGDIDMVLAAPGGSPSIQPVSRIGVTAAGSFGDSSNYGGTYNFTDSAAGANIWTVATDTNCGDGCIVAAGNYRSTGPGQAGQTNPPPVTNLTATFTGLSAAQINGTWTLTLRDAAAEDTGSVTAANLTIGGGGGGGNFITVTGGANGSGNGTVNYSVAQNNTGQSRTGTMTIAGQTFTVNQSSAVISRKQFDFDGDGKADISVFRPGNGAWYLLQSQNGFTGMIFGLGTDKLVPGDYDGDGKTDIAVFRSGIWYLQRSSLGFTGVAFGEPTDIPVPGDYDGDGKTDIAVFRPSNGAWYLLQSSAGFTGMIFGISTDKPVPADYDGDGKTDVAVNRSGTWYLMRSQLGFTGMVFGTAEDKLVPADYDGDGKADVAVFRPSNGVWYLMRSHLGFTGVAFGLGTDKPVPADYDGDGKADVAVYRDGIWYLLRSQAGFTGVAFGEATDKPIPNSYVP